MYLVIAEKPSVSRAIARVIRAENREEGFKLVPGASGGISAAGWL